MPNPDQDWRWLGNQAVDVVIDWTLQKMGLPKNERQALSQKLYNTAMAEALEQFQRIAALEIAIPGDPNFDLHDLLGQAGREDPKLKYLANRELYRYDWLDSNPVIKTYHDKLASYIKLRKILPVLNTGSVVFPLDPTRPAEAELISPMILPLIRDNGKDQAICLVNFGNPQNSWDTWQQSQNSPEYPEIHSQQPKVENYKLPLKFTGIPVGTRYKSVDPEAHGEEIYGVNPNQELVKMNPDGTFTNQGINIHIARTLLRIK